MKQIKVKVLIASAITLGLVSCLKKDAMNIDPDSRTANIVELAFVEGGSGTTINSGMQYFGGAALSYPASHTSDTATYTVSYAGADVLTKDLNVTIGINKSAILDNYKTDSIAYELMPDSLFKMVATKATIKAGSRTAPLQIIFYPSKIDITKSYMLPVVVTDAEGKTISGNFGIIYFHVIGNPLAGNYIWDWSRWNAPDSTSQPKNSLSFTGHSTTFAPINPTTFEVATGYYTGPRYTVTFKNSGGVLSNFKVEFNKADLDYATEQSGGGVTFGPITVLKTDYINKVFQFQYIAYSGSSPRYIVDTYHKQ